MNSWHHIPSDDASHIAWLECEVCGYRVPKQPSGGHDLKHDCTVPQQQLKPAPQRPPLLKRLKNFTVAAIAHELRGAPTCTDEQIAERHAICKACELYIKSEHNANLGVCGHSDCGCSLGRASKYLNKLAWADQQCPLGKWPRLDVPTA
jgi:hypothetical protein